MQKAFILVAGILLGSSQWGRADNPYSLIPDSAHARLHPDLLFAGENKDFKLFYDKNISYYTQRKQAIVYLLIEAKTVRDYRKQEPNGQVRSYRYRYMLQRTDMDCSRGIYVADLVTYFEEGSGRIIEEDIAGMPFKVNKGSLVDTVYREICAQMQPQVTYPAQP